MKRTRSIGPQGRADDDEHKELVELRRRNRVLEMENRDPQAGVGLFRQGERAPKIGFRLVRELADAYLANQVVDMHELSRGCYGTPQDAH